jgi:hypothetical protein
MVEDVSSVSFENFRAAWLESVQAGNPSTVDLGRRFALKLISQILDADEASADIVYCDGAGDGGIDVAILDTGPDESNAEPEQSGHRWYLVQSKYGSAFRSTSTLLAEGQKIIETLDGRRTQLSSITQGLLERLQNFRNGAGPSDSIVLVFGTENPLDEDEKRALADLRVMGRARLGAFFDVESISIETVYRRLQEAHEAEQEDRLKVDLRAQLVPSGEDLLIGSVGLLDMYDFLRAYRDKTGDLDQIFEKNVRRFLGARGRVNKGMQETLRDAPERFGLYNNGITVVASTYSQREGGVTLTEPFIVNGCQTSRTLWEVFHNRLAAGGTGVNPEIEAWKDKARDGVAVLKIVRTGDQGDNLLHAITRYTNSQNAVREKDFIALTGDFQRWKRELADQYNLYLEIQRGGWDSQRALQTSNPQTHQFERSANAADLIKVYGAGWLGEPGLAFGKNPPFLPNGSVFNRIVNSESAGGAGFGAPDVYAAYLLQQAANRYGFGRGAEKQSRSQTKFLFYYVTIELLRDALSKEGRPADSRSISHALIKLAHSEEAQAALYDQSVELIDSYMTQASDNCVFKERSYVEDFNYDLNAFLKSTQLGKSETTPLLRDELGIQKSAMGKSFGGHPSARKTIVDALNMA